MPINQISTSNTFSNWLNATQALIDKYNYFEVASNTVLTTANIVYATSNNMNAQSNVVNSNTHLVVSLSTDVNNKSASVNAQTSLVLSTSNNLHIYVNSTYSTVNSVSIAVNANFSRTNSSFLHANSGFNHANGAYLKANGGFNHANGAFIHANGAYVHINSLSIFANSAYNTANLAVIYADNAYLTSNNASDRVNTILLLANTANLVVIRDDSNTTTQYVALTPNTSGLFSSVNVSSRSLLFNPSTGTLYTNVKAYSVNTYSSFGIINSSNTTLWNVTTSGANLSIRSTFDIITVAPTGVVQMIYGGRSVTFPVDTSNSGIATTSFVANQASSNAPLMNGEVAAGTGFRFSRDNHVHPSDTSKAYKTVANTGGIISPYGNTAQRPAGTDKYIRYNTDLNGFEGYNGESWGSLGGGATGGGSDKIFIENSLIVTANYTISNGKSAMSTGPITISDGIVVTVPDGSRWVIL